MRSIGQNAPISRHFGRYGLGDSDKFLYGSTTSITHLRVARVIAVKVSKGLEFPRSGAARRGAYAIDERRRAGCGAGVLCGGDAGDAEVGDWGGWGFGMRLNSVESIPQS